MQPHQQRVIDEKTELDAKIDKLNLFSEGNMFQQLPAAEQDRLLRQLTIMVQYSDVLAERIAAFTP